MSSRPPLASCQSLHEPSHFSTHLTVTTCLLGLGVSVGFLRKTWRQWLISSGIRPVQRIAIEIKASPLAKASDTSTHDSTMMPTIVKTAETSAATTASHTSLHAIPILRAASHRRRPFHFCLLPTLLLLTWTLFALDHVLMLLVTATLLWHCPQFNCFTRILHVSGTCPAAALFAVMVFMEALGACAFVLATVIRFVNLFAILSRPRWIALRVGCGLVAAVTVVRVLALVVRVVLFRSAESAVGRALDVPVVHAVTEATYVAFYAVVGIACLVSLAVGVQYVFEVRRKVREAGVSSFSLTQASTMGTSAGSSASGQPHLLDGGSLTLVPPAISRASANFTHLSSMVFSRPQQLRWPRLSHRDRIVHHTRMVLVWIASAMATLAAFVAIMLIPGVATRMPALFLNAFMTMFLKCFSAFVTLAIGSMTQLVLSHKG